MKIYSWNMMFFNAKQDLAFEFIEQSNFDIFCLQEVPEEFLERLKTLPYFITFRVDEELICAKCNKNIYIVILSKYPFVATGEISFPDYWMHMHTRSRLFIRLMRPFNIFKARNHGGLYCDLIKDGKTIRVFSLHVKMLARPEWRLKEFETAMEKHDISLPTIVCGDLNIFDNLYFMPLNWLLGSRLRDILFYRAERILFEKKFTAYRFINALRGKITHPLSRSQLDHILVSDSFSIKNAEVIPNRIGSDHHPVRVEIE